MHCTEVFQIISKASPWLDFKKNKDKTSQYPHTHTDKSAHIVIECNKKIHGDACYTFSTGLFQPLFNLRMKKTIGAVNFHPNLRTFE